MIEATIVINKHSSQVVFKSNLHTPLFEANLPIDTELRFLALQVVL